MNYTKHIISLSLIGLLSITINADPEKRSTNKKNENKREWKRQNQILWEVFLLQLV